MSTIPKHIVLFPDGNRRWAEKKGLNTLLGHRAGYRNLIQFCHWCRKKGVKIITAFGFSTENWKRSKKEVSYLMNLLERGMLEFRNKEYEKMGLRVRMIGQKEILPRSLQNTIQKIEKITEKNNNLFLNLAVSYGGKWDIIQAIKKILKQGISAQSITEELVSGYLSTAGLPDPDLIIRAGGEKRLSNFLLWQAAYSELYFSPKYWPDFTEKDLDEALAEYERRQRRFGE